jgi:hypothetical protein
MTNTEWLRQHLYAKAGIFDHHKPIPLAELERTEWNKEFEILMRNRLMIGALRYGRMHRPEKGNYNCIDSIAKRLIAYSESGNLEHLVDIANLALVEFTHGKHPNRHFHSTDDGDHVKSLLS